MAKYLALGVAAWYYHKEIFFYCKQLWSHDFRKLEYNQGILSEVSMVLLLQTIQQDLKYTLRKAYQTFIEERQQVYEIDDEKYKNTVRLFLKNAATVKADSICHTLSSFGLNSEDFNYSLNCFGENEKIQMILAGIEEDLICNEIIPENLTLTKAIILLNLYTDKMKEKQSSGDPVERFKIIDEINKEYHVNELDLYLIFEVYKGCAGMSDIKKQVLELEQQFAEEIQGNI